MLHHSGLRRYFNLQEDCDDNGVKSQAILESKSHSFENKVMENGSPLSICQKNYKTVTVDNAQCQA